MIPLGKGLSIGKKEYENATLGTAVSVAPLYDSLFAVGAGFNLSFGLKDKTAPKIVLELPTAFRGTTHISPDGDGIKDTLVIPLKITDQRYISGWEMKIEDKSSGKTVRKIGETNFKEESFSGISSIGRSFAYVKKNVKVPETDRKSVV